MSRVVAGEALPMPVSVFIAAEFSPTPAQQAGWLAALPSGRQAELQAREPKARHRSLLASRLLAAALHRAGHPPALLATWRQAPRARPTLAAALDFSLSHCDGRVVCALSSDGPVGVDVETVADVRAAEFMRYLDADERAWAGRSARRFASLWTRKEAVVKAAGSDGLRALADVRTQPDGRVATLAGCLWHVVALPVGAGHVGHVALAAPQALRIVRLRGAALAAL